MYVCARAYCVQLYGGLFFSSAGLHAVNVCVFVCVLTYVSTYCMHGKALCVSDLTPYFHAKVTPDDHIFWLRRVMELTATQSDIENFTLLEDILL